MQRWRAHEGGLLRRPDPEIRERWLAAALFGATALSVALVQSATFAAALLAILGVHEAAHRIVARAHGMRVSLPLFLPAPFFVGTLGAVIRLEDRPPGRTALAETAAAGPLAGLVAALVAMALALAGDPPGGGDPLARPLAWGVLSAVLRGGSAPLTTADPLGYAAWVGCLVTAMNLLPFGQLDGGHLSSALAPGRARAVGTAVTVALGVLGFAWPWWWAWALALHLLGAGHPLAVEEPREPPSLRARVLAGACVAAFAACFVPVPW